MAPRVPSQKVTLLCVESRVWLYSEDRLSEGACKKSSQDSGHPSSDGSPYPHDLRLPSGITHMVVSTITDQAWKSCLVTGLFLKLDQLLSSPLLKHLSLWGLLMGECSAAGPAHFQTSVPPPPQPLHISPRQSRAVKMKVAASPLRGCKCA